ncbi:hypothetical protein H9Y04_28495 [Streptomyces sp. TRM66268-LWL]|uniref:Lipoprotein n=1 Tax=Streptomyces polyasparticus TaxID=2767826 RepID=A0ABR7SM17_9ACTN|nr:hypothetical protein [Streptomyces polyasparticus]MBC9716478.1 hypothetical protein [Streptomyces polyasparticus]
MTSLRFSAKSRRVAATLGAVSAGLLVLSACEKPSPVATVTFGSDSVSTDATCYEHSKNLGMKEAAACALKKSTKTIKVKSGETLRVGVDPKVAETGWALWINGQQATNPYKKTYYSFEGIDLFAPQQGQPAPKTLYVSVVEQDEMGKKVKGVWNFKLENADA